MAPQASPTALAAVATPTYSTVAPLTTTWTPPASCASQIPSVYLGGTCNSKGCTTYDATKIATMSWDAWLSLGGKTLGGVQVNTGCAPPSTSVGVNFWYSPAVGCPSGYHTQTSWTGYYSDLSVVCCPSIYGNYQCYKYITAPETVSMVAWGTIYGSDSSGYITGTYNTYSPISTTVIQPTTRAGGTTPWIYAEAVRMVVTSSAKSTTTVYPSYYTTTNPYPNYTSYPNPVFHIGPLNTVYSIVVLVVSAVIGLIIACCCCYRCCRSPRPKPMQPSPITAAYPPPYTHTRSEPSPVYPRPAPIQAKAPSIICPHPTSEHCRNKINGGCCACSDKRSGKMSKEDRVRTYCIFCNLFWKEIPNLLCPPEWQLIGPPCAHNQNKKCEGEQESYSCCGCIDKRSEFLDLDFRVSNYCPICRRAWETKQPKDWPATWGRSPRQPAQSNPQPQVQSPAIGSNNPWRTSFAKKPTQTMTGASSGGLTPKQSVRMHFKRDPKELSKEIELSILSRTSKEPDVEPMGPTTIESADSDRLTYGSPKLQVAPDSGSSQSLPTRPPPAATPGPCNSHPPTETVSMASSSN
ncbi:hypothetical protein BGZ60DRAFT_434092 [Tricladium varicosporioides]|nr:hypothetical protein BGZ60DRAFT_434092 [Hymenoscyphus varicosporioides]